MRIPRSQALGQIVVVAIGLWCAAQAMIALPFIVVSILDTSGPAGGLYWGSAAHVGLYAILGVGFLALRVPLATTLFARDLDFEIEDLSAERAVRVIVGCMGLWLATTSLLRGIGLEINALIEFEQFRGVGGIDPGRGTVLVRPEAWSARLDYLPHLFVGVLFLFRSGPITRRVLPPQITS